MTRSAIHLASVLAFAFVLLTLKAEEGVLLSFADSGQQAPQADVHVISIGDQVICRVTEDRERAWFLVVSTPGDIFVPPCGWVRVAGKTLGQAAEEIRDLIEKEHSNRVSVTLSRVGPGKMLVTVPSPERSQAAAEAVVSEKTSSSGGAGGPVLKTMGGRTAPTALPPDPDRKQIHVVGLVRLQGAQDIPSDEKYLASQAISRAGGFSPFANGRKVQIFRKASDGKIERITVDVLSVLKDGKLQNDAELQPDDTVLVPEKLVNF